MYHCTDLAPLLYRNLYNMSQQKHQLVIYDRAVDEFAQCIVSKVPAEYWMNSLTIRNARPITLQELESYKALQLRKGVSGFVGLWKADGTWCGSLAILARIAVNDPWANVLNSYAQHFDDITWIKKHIRP